VISITPEQFLVNSMQKHLEKVRSDAAECLLLSSLAHDKSKDMFAQVAQHLTELASEMEKTPLANPSNVVAAEFIPIGPAVDHVATSGKKNVVVVPSEKGAEPDGARQNQKSRRPWLFVAVVGTVAGFSLWASPLPDRLHWHFASYLPSFQVSENYEIGSSPKDGADAIAALEATERSERDAIFKRINELDAQVGSIEAELEKFRNSQALAMSSGEKAPPRNERRGQIRGNRRAPPAGFFGFFGL
jgi:hypothetical protein